MFSRLFKKRKPVRSLSHPKDLLVGDMLQLIDSFALPPELKGQTLRVVAVNTYQYEYSSETELVLKGASSTPIFLHVEEEDGESWANFSMKIQRDDVDALFGLDQFAEIFDSEDMTQIQRINELAGLERWTDTEYVQASAPESGYFYNADYRGKTLPQFVEDGGEPFDTISLASPSGTHFIGIEIWHDGETDVGLTVCRPLSDITELYAGEGEN